jgi:hypothetical protein
MVIVPKEPTPAMVEASMRAIQGMGLMNKPRKHLLRLRAAIKAGRTNFGQKRKRHDGCDIEPSRAQTEIPCHP